MATLSLQYSQDVVDTLHDIDDGEGDGLSQLVDTILELQYLLTQHDALLEAYSINGSELWLFYPDGWAELYEATFEDPDADSGYVYASGYKLTLQGAAIIGYDGELKYQYELGEQYVKLGYTQLEIRNYLFVSQFPAQQTDPVFGNGAIKLEGDFTIFTGGAVFGTLDKVLIAAEKFLSFSSVEGDFSLSGNIASIANGDSSSNISGELHRLEVVYQDGSFLLFETDPEGLSLSGTQDPLSLLEFPENFPGNDEFSIVLPDQVHDAEKFFTGPGDDTLHLSGGTGKIAIDAGPGNDEVSKGSLGHDINGGTGIDTVAYDGESSDYEVSAGGGASKITVSAKANPASQDQLVNIEYIRFGNTVAPVSDYIANTPASGKLLIYGDAEVGKSLLAETRAIVDVDGVGDFNYQWYRNGEVIPGQAGALYQLTAQDEGQVIGAAVSFMDGFGHSESVMAESRLASDPTSPFYTGLIQMYVIILGRAPAQGGLDFWSGIINEGKDFEYVAGEMWNSAGAREFYPSDMTTEEIVTSVYINILVREPKEAGLDYWVGQWEENGAVETMLEMIAALTANNSSDPLAIADKELFQAKVDIGGYLANTVGNTDVGLAGDAFDYLESGHSVEETRAYIDNAMGVLGQGQPSGGEDLFA